MKTKRSTPKTASDSLNAAVLMSVVAISLFISAARDVLLSLPFILKSAAGLGLLVASVIVLVKRFRKNRE